jgi:peptide deformylase
LSFPNKTIKSRRYNEVYITNNAVEPNSFVITGLGAVVVAHEMNHWDGILLPDFEV